MLFYSAIFFLFSTCLFSLIFHFKFDNFYVIHIHIVWMSLMLKQKKQNLLVIEFYDCQIKLKSKWKIFVD